MMPLKCNRVVSRCNPAALLTSLRCAGSSTSGSTTTTTTNVGQTDPAAQTLLKKLRVRCLLAKCPVGSLSTANFIALCTSAAAVPPQERMNKEEATSYLTALHNARVVLVDDGMVYLRPLDVVNRVHAAANIPLLSLALPADQSNIDALEKEHATFQRRAVAAVERAGLWRKRFWSTVAVGSGAQMAALSYLTFVQYDWDVMEPACYFVTCTTSIVFYLYFLYYRREQSLPQVDENYLPKKLEGYFREADVDTNRWMTVLKELQELKDVQVGAPRQPSSTGEECEVVISEKEWVEQQLEKQQQQ